MNKNYITLEYDKVLNKIQEYVKLPKTLEFLNSEKLYINKNELENEFKIIQDTLDFYKYDLGFELNKLYPLDDIFKTLRILGSYLNVEDIVYIRNNINTYRISKSRIKNLKDKYKNLYAIFNNDINFQELENVLNDILDGDEISDNASIGLRDIRKQKQIINQNIKDKILEIFNNKDLQKAVADHISTTRNDRVVIAVKTDFKYLIKGIEHDKSSSGNTTYIEPIKIVSLNNQLKEYESREREEIRKILIKISEYIRNYLDMLILMYDKLIYLDLLNAKILFSIKYDCNIPNIVNKEYVKLIDAKHPLIDKEKVVPLTFSIGDDEKNIMLITGPNTGGKTIALKTAGLLTLMTLLAIPIPASEKTEIGIFNNILVDIGDEQSIEQNLSSFSAHVTKISEIIKNANSKSLIIMDEIGSGTDPIEGSSFAMAVIDYLRDKNSKVIVSTHYSELKYHAINDSKIKSASMEFNVETLMPTYKLIVGIPGESNALIIASKYGIPEDIINKAKSYVSDDNKKIESIITDLKKQNEELTLAKEEILKTKEESERLKSEFEEKINKLELEKNEIIEKTHKEADEYMKSMQNKVKNIIDKINNDETKKEELKNMQKNINMIRASIVEDKKKKIKEVDTKVNIKYEVGEEVFLKTLNQKAKILKILNDNKSLQLQAGILKLVVDSNEVMKLQKEKKKNITSHHSKTFKEVKGEIDVRGMYAEDAIYEIEKYLDRALLTGYNKIYIIHGKGTMVLRKKIHDYLKNSHYVKEIENANPSEGGLGCTVVTLK